MIGPQHGANLRPKVQNVKEMEVRVEYGGPTGRDEFPDTEHGHGFFESKVEGGRLKKMKF